MITVNLLNPKAPFFNSLGYIIPVCSLTDRKKVSSSKLTVLQSPASWGAPMRSGRELSYAVLDRIIEAQALEIDPWLKDDRQISRQCVVNARRGVKDPWGFAFWSTLGITHAKFLKHLAAREAKLRSMGPSLAELGDGFIHNPPINDAELSVQTGVTGALGTRKLSEDGVLRAAEKSVEYSPSNFNLYASAQAEIDSPPRKSPLSERNPKKGRAA